MSEPQTPKLVQDLDEQDQKDFQLLHVQYLQAKANYADAMKAVEDADAALRGLLTTKVAKYQLEGTWAAGAGFKRLERRG